MRFDQYPGDLPRGDLRQPGPAHEKSVRRDQACLRHDHVRVRIPRQPSNQTSRQEPPSGTRRRMLKTFFRECQTKSLLARRTRGSAANPPGYKSATGSGIASFPGGVSGGTGGSLPKTPDSTLARRSFTWLNRTSTASKRASFSPRKEPISLRSDVDPLLSGLSCSKARG